MIMTRTMLVVGAAIYVLLWVIAANGAGQLVPILAIPGVLAVMIALGVVLDRFIGITPRKQHFDDGPHEREQ